MEFDTASGTFPVLREGQSDRKGKRGKGGKTPSVLAAIRKENGVVPCTLLRRDHVMDNH